MRIQHVPVSKALREIFARQRSKTGLLSFFFFFLSPSLPSFLPSFLFPFSSLSLFLCHIWSALFFSYSNLGICFVQMGRSFLTSLDLSSLQISQMTLSSSKMYLVCFLPLLSSPLLSSPLLSSPLLSSPLLSSPPLTPSPQFVTKFLIVITGRMRRDVPRVSPQRS